MEFWTRSQARAEGRFDEFAKIFSSVPSAVRPAKEAPLLWPAPLWVSLLQLPFPRPTEFWVTRSGHQRIGANVSLTNPDVGFIGFFETDTSTKEALAIGKGLLHEAEAFLKSKGVKTVYGPLNYNTWFPYRFGLPKDDELTFSWEPFQPKEYPQVWMEGGFTVCESYQSVGLGDLQGYAEKCRPAYERAVQEGYSFRPVDADRLESHEIPALYEISMEGFRDNFLFEPLDPQGFAGIYVPAMKKADLSYSFFVLDKNGKEVGFFYGFVDQGYLVLKTVAVRNEARGKGLSNALTYLQATAALAKGHSKMITALVKTGAQSESYKKKATPLWTHDYVLLKKEI